MCEPSTLIAASLAISAAAQGASLAAQKAEGSAQAKYQAELTQANSASTSQQLTALRTQQAQNTESVARENQKAKLVNDRAKATAQVAADEAGVAGNSVDALLREYDGQLGAYRETTQRQRKLQDDAYEVEALNIALGGKNQALNINAPVLGPNYLAAGVSFAGSALGAYRAYKPLPGTSPKPVKK